MCIAKGSDVRPGVPWAPPLLRGRRGTMCTAKGSDVRPGVPWAPPLLRGRRGTMCTAKGSDVRPGVPLALPLLRGRRQAWDNVHCWWLLRGRRGTLCSHSFTLTHSLLLALNHWLIRCNHSYTHTPLTHIHSHSLTCACTYIHTHTNSPTITPPSLLYFLFPSCFSMPSLSLEKLVTCGVIRSYNSKWSNFFRVGPLEAVSIKSKRFKQFQKLDSVHLFSASLPPIQTAKFGRHMPQTSLPLSISCHTTGFQNGKIRFEWPPK